MRLLLILLLIFSLKSNGQYVTLKIDSGAYLATKYVGNYGAIIQPPIGAPASSHESFVLNSYNFPAYGNYPQVSVIACQYGWSQPNYPYPYYLIQITVHYLTGALWFSNIWNGNGYLYCYPNSSTTFSGEGKFYVRNSLDSTDIRFVELTIYEVGN
jgi:hypothetical protein